MLLGFPTLSVGLFLIIILRILLEWIITEHQIVERLRKKFANKGYRIKSMVNLFAWLASWIGAFLILYLLIIILSKVGVSENILDFLGQ